MYHAIMRPLRLIERWIAYRTYEKYHIVKTDLKPDYYDKDIIMLHCCFSLLKDYVEKELHSISGNLTLDKMIELCKDNYQFENDGSGVFWETVKELYIWWTVKRPQRIEPMEKSGAYHFIYQMNCKYGELYSFTTTEGPFLSLTSNLTAAESKELDKRIDLSQKIEKENDLEDDEMLRKLLKIRLFLWT
jgi:hypothetical protein